MRVIIGILNKINAADKNKDKEKATHTVQLLPLITCSQNVTVEVTHQIVEHECALTFSPWQPTYCPYELICFCNMIEVQQVCVLVDDDSTHNFLNYTLIKNLDLHKSLVLTLM